MEKITPHLWFDRQAVEAAELYVSTFPNSQLTKVTKLSGTPSGDCDLVSFQLAGSPFMAISAGPLFRFNPSISFHGRCETADEVDSIWARLSDGGKVLMPLDRYPWSERYGWLEDRYGVSWQVIHAGDRPIAQKIVPALMFVGDVLGQAKAAIDHYVSVFANAPAANAESAVKLVSPGEGNSVQYAEFLLAGQEFIAMDSPGPHPFAFNEAISLTIPCDTQEEIDYFWDKLSADPTAGQCGWQKDRFGVSWQITPAIMGELLRDKDRAQRVTQAFLKMKKFDIAALKEAAG